MKVTDFTREVLRHRRHKKKMLAAGYVCCEVHWQFHRGGYLQGLNRLADVQIDVDGQHVWYKVDTRPAEEALKAIVQREMDFAKELPWAGVRP